MIILDSSDFLAGGSVSLSLSLAGLMKQAVALGNPI